MHRAVPDGTTELMPPPGPLRPMDNAVIRQAAMADPDSHPWSDEEFERVKLAPPSKAIRRALHLTQEEFSARFHIPLGTLRDWEQGRTEQDQPARAYLRVIAADPLPVQRALEGPPCQPH